MPDCVSNEKNLETEPQSMADDSETVISSDGSENCSSGDDSGITNTKSIKISDMAASITSHWKNQDDIVISGISGRFPESDNMAEFEHNLMNAEDMITEDDRRWPVGFGGLPRRHGKIKEVKKFDAQAFGVTPKQANAMDPQLRILLEVAYEAIMDSGNNPFGLRGNRTGVFVGVSASETSSAVTDPELVDGYGLLGTDTCMWANRLSYAFGFTGPSFPVNTACSSSMVALHVAMQSIRDGLCDSALVAATHTTLLPPAALHVNKLSMTSVDGACRAFDASAKGYVRSEGIAAVYIQRVKSAKRKYASVVHVKTNSDGYKEQGITFPSGAMQAQLLKEFYEEINIDPSVISFVETHGTGTPVGDPQEANTVCDIFCTKKRKSPLLIGSVKSNMGHSEPTAGLAQLAKMVIAMERDIIPPNLHYKEPNPNIPGLKDGRLKVVAEPTPWSGGLVGINSFGFGGSNVHVLLKSNQEKPLPLPETRFPKLLCYAGRTQEAAEEALRFAEEHKTNDEALMLLSEPAADPPPFMVHRGYAILNETEGAVKVVQKSIENQRPVWFVYSGMGTQWTGMGSDLLEMPLFRDSIYRCAEVLKPYQVDLIELLTDMNADVVDNTLNSFITIVAVQIALTDVLKHVGINPDGIVGHSFGEVACGYADQCLSLEECMLTAYWRGRCIMEGNLEPGAMAAIGLSIEEAEKRLPQGIYVACHNANDSVTVSGPAQAIEAFVTELKADEVFAKKVKSAGVAFHSSYLNPVAETIKQKMETIIVKSQPRSNKWISTSVSIADPNNNIGEKASPEYYSNNLVAPVIFYDAIKTIPSHAVIIEIAPHALLQAVVKRTIPKTALSFGLMDARTKNNLEYFLGALGKAYINGLSVHAHKLLPQISYPVSKGTPMLGSLMKWDHSTNWNVVMFDDVYGKKNSACSSFVIDPFNRESKEHQYLLHHTLDGRPLFPMAGFMVLAWKAFSKLHGTEWQETPVVIENTKLFRGTPLVEPVTFDVYMTKGNPDFSIMDGEMLILSGTIHHGEEEKPFFYDYFDPEGEGTDDMPCKKVRLDRSDVYKQIRIRGYDYGPHFQGISSSCNCGHESKIRWNGNWVPFIDSMTQTSLLAKREGKHLLPIRLRYIRIDPVRHMKHIYHDEAADSDMVNCYADSCTKGMFAGGVELRDLVVHSVARRLPKTQTVSLEKKYFIPFFDDECFKDWPNLRQNLSSYQHKLAEYARTAFAQCMRNYQLPVGTSLTGAGSIRTRRTSFSEDLAKSDSEHLIVAKTLAAMGSAETDAEMKSISEEYLSDLGEDPLFSSMWHPRAFKPLLDIALQNIIGKVVRCVQTDPRNDGMISVCKSLLSQHPQREPDCCVVGVQEKIESLFGDADTSSWTSYFMDFDKDSVIPGPLEKSQDLILIDRVLYTKADPLEYLQSLRAMMSEQSFIIASEVTDCFEVMQLLDYLEEGSFGSGNSQNNNLEFSHENWLALFDKAGFAVHAWQRDLAVSFCTSYLLRPKPTEEIKPTIINVDDIEEFTWLHEAQDALQNLRKAPPNETLWLVSTETPDNGLNGLILCLKEESQIPIRVRMIHDARFGAEKKGPLSRKDMDERIKHNLLENIYENGKWGVKILIAAETSQVHRRRQTEHAFLHPLIRGNLASITWIESSNGLWYDYPKEFDDEQMFGVYYGSLNFRDIMLATGRLVPDAVPGNISAREHMIGFEFSGREMKTGCRVMGITLSESIGTTLATRRSKLWNVPDDWTLEQAATVPVVYLTAYNALVMRGHLKRGESILIHSGSGGVGQAAIRLALSIGCEVFTTVGTEAKRKFLLDTFDGLRTDHIGDSRSTSFEYMVQRVTKGKGVDAVLNSLSEDKLQASIRCLGVNGRFLEIGKYDLMNDSPAGLGVLLKNVSICGIVLEHVLGEELDEAYRLVAEGLKDGTVRPLPACVFPHTDAEGAFRFMAQGKHIGKTLIKMRSEEDQKDAIPPKMSVSAVSRTFCIWDHVYIVTGGLGGFGLELCDWLVQRGARKIVVTSRTGVKTGYQQRLINHWKENRGVEVMVKTNNIAKLEETRDLMRESKEMGPIGGIFHLAMVLRDAMFENQTVDNFKESSQQKYWGTKNLDEASREFCTKKDLSWFVVFSSVTSGRGHKGQTCYGWANSAMEQIVLKRHKEGLKGLAIEWGAIGDVGVILEHMGDNTTVVGGTLPQRMFSCLETMDMILNWKHPVVSSFIKASSAGFRSKENVKSGELVDKIGRIFGVSSAKDLDPDAKFGELGLDSLMGVEIRETIEKEYGVLLSPKDIRMLTINSLKEMIVSGGARTDGDGSSADDVDMNIMQIYGIRASADDLRPTEPLVRINDVTEGDPVFCVHSFEGVAANLKYIGAMLKVPAYCLQCTPDAPLDTIEDLAAYYISNIRSVKPAGPYRLLGYSFGATLAIEMALQLQEAGESVSQLLCLDSSQRYLQVYGEKMKQHYGLGSGFMDSPFYESELLTGFTVRFITVDPVLFGKELLALSTWNDRLTTVVDRIMAMGSDFHDAETVRFAAQTVYDKYKAGDKYNPAIKTHFRGDVTLIRAQNGIMKAKEVGDDYGVQEIVDGEVTVHVVPGDHDSFIHDVSGEKVAALINAALAGGVAA